MSGPRITFHGAAETVTGSRTLVEGGDRRLLVDCGLFQGLKKLRLRNREPLPFDPAALDGVVLTHAHIDHSGYLPRLCRDGYDGPVHVTAGTRDLLGVLLPDAGRLQEEYARHANKHGWSRHAPAEPLYTEADALACLEQLTAHDWHTDVEVADGMAVRFGRAGHILGASHVTVTAGGRRIAFSGDVGRSDDPIMSPPEPLPECDALVVESTYGDRRHPREGVREVLAHVVRRTAERRGIVVVPAFAVGRAQHVLHLLSELRAEGRIPAVPTVLDSPMAIDATEIFCRHPDDHRLTPEQCRAMCDGVEFTRDREDSKRINQRSGPMVIVSASGMATGGRVLHHLKRALPGESNTVLVVGWQAAGTRGRSLVDGADDIKIHGSYVPVRARIVQAHGLSAHADHAEILDWLRDAPSVPGRIFVNHGEPAAADAMRRRVRDALGVEATVAQDGTAYELE